MWQTAVPGNLCSLWLPIGSQFESMLLCWSVVSPPLGVRVVAAAKSATVVDLCLLRPVSHVL
jgi:hypothetical protein